MIKLDWNVVNARLGVTHYCYYKISEISIPVCCSINKNKEKWHVSFSYDDLNQLYRKLYSDYSIPANNLYAAQEYIENFIFRFEKLKVLV